MAIADTEPKAFKQAANILALLANINRLRMLDIMFDREISVGQLAREVGLTQSATSQHLAQLVSSGLVVQRKSQQTRFCCVNERKKAMLQRLITIAEQFQHNG